MKKLLSLIVLSVNLIWFSGIANAEYPALGLYQGRLPEIYRTSYPGGPQYNLNFSPKFKFRIFTRNKGKKLFAKIIMENFGIPEISIKKLKGGIFQGEVSYPLNLFPACTITDRVTVKHLAKVKGSDKPRAAFTFYEVSKCPDAFKGGEEVYSGILLN